MSVKSQHLRMKAPTGSSGLTIGVDEYKPDKQGVILVPLSHVEQAKSHGFTALDPEPPGQAKGESDPNTQRPGNVAGPQKLKAAELTEAEQAAAGKPADEAAGEKAGEAKGGEKK